MQKRKFVGQGAGDASLPELLNRLERALAECSVHGSVWKRLSDIKMRLASCDEEAAALTRRSPAARRSRPPVVETLPLFS
jgi:hypothetical protein